MKILTGRICGNRLFSTWIGSVSCLFFVMSSGIGWTQDKTLPAVTALAMAPDNRTVLVGSQVGVSIRGIKSKDASILPVKLDHVLCMAFAPDCKTLAIGGGQAAEAGTVELWSWPDKKLRGRLEGHADLVHDLAWFPDGNTLATASADRTVRLWDVAKKKAKSTLSGHSGPVLSIAVLPDGKTICSGSADQTIRVWNVIDDKLIRALDNHLGAVNALAVRPGRGKDDPVILASAGNDNTVRIWQPEIGRQVRIVRHPAPVFAIAWNHDGSLLTSAGKDGTLRSIDGDSDQIFQERLVSKGWIISLCRPRGSDEIWAGTTIGDIVMN
jgi:WD40 repeat protein